MRRKEVLHGFAGMVAGAILDEQEVLLGLGQHIFQECHVAFGVETVSMPLPKQMAGEEVDQAEDLVAFALTAGLDRGLLPFGRPSVAQGTPLGEAGLITEQDHGLLRLGHPANLGPRLRQPALAGRFIKVVRHKPGFLKGEAQFIQQLADIMWMIRHAKARQN